MRGVRPTSQASASGGFCLSGSIAGPNGVPYRQPLKCVAGLTATVL